MGKAYFEFKQFTIRHDRCAMKVGTDGVLLGAWTEIGPEVRHVVDIGTGSGLIAIMLAQRSMASVIGLEIEPDAAEQAADNARMSPWGERLRIVRGDAMAFVPAYKFDIAVCNPPFFDDALLCPDQKRNNARHNSVMPFGALIRTVAGWLAEDGLFNVILPVQAADDFAQAAWENGLNLQRKCVVYGRSGQPPKRVLQSFRKGHTSYPSSETLCIRDEAGQYTPEYKRLTADYYLHF